MELTYDWKGFQSLFYLKKRPSSTGPALSVVLEGNVLVAARSEGEDLSDWLGATFDELAAEFPDRQIFAFERKQIDSLVQDSIALPHFYDLLCFLKKGVEAKNRHRSTTPLPEAFPQRHLLLHSLGSWWNKFLPSHYGIYVRLDGSPSSSLFLLVNRGRIETFHVPDLSSLLSERRRFPQDVVRHLSENYRVPVQGLFLTRTEWTDWSEADLPWPMILSTLKKHRNKLVPFRRSLLALLAAKVYFKI